MTRRTVGSGLRRYFVMLGILIIMTPINFAPYSSTDSESEPSLFSELAPRIMAEEDPHDLAVDSSEIESRYPTDRRCSTCATGVFPEHTRGYFDNKGIFTLPDAAGANRAPPRRALKLSNIGSNHRNGPLMANQTVCWSTEGSQPMSYLPGWVISLMRGVAFAGIYERLRIAAEVDPWRVLVGWYAEKFAAQSSKPGRRAGGGQMWAPNRGADPQYYRHRYNSTWSADVDDSTSGVLNFQLVHRNALRVCIRERLHFVSLRCSAMSKEDGERPHLLPPIIIYFCNCRHCKETRFTRELGHGSPTLDDAWQSMPLLNSTIIDVASFLAIFIQNSSIVPMQQRGKRNSSSVSVPATPQDFPLLHVSDSVPTSSMMKFLGYTSLGMLMSKKMGLARFLQLPKHAWNNDIYLARSDSQKRENEDESCVDAYAAPWLVPSEYQFPYEFLRTDSATNTAFNYNDDDSTLSTLLAAQADENKVVLMALFNEFWIDHLHNFWYTMNHFGKSRHAIIATLDNRSFTLCQKQRLPCFDATAYADIDLTDENTIDVGHKKRVSDALSWAKPRLAVAVLSRGYSFLLSDLDITWYGNAFGRTALQQTGLAHQCDVWSKKGESINSGWYLARPSVNMLLYFNNLMFFEPDETSDQTSMKLLIKYDHTFGGIKHSCLDKWSFQMKCYYKIGKPSIINGKETFLWRQMDTKRKSFSWVLHHATCLDGAHSKMIYFRTMNMWFLDDLDALHLPLCLRLPDGKKLWSSKSTAHSATFTRDTDSKYLQKRH